jgi:hypothetical protein
MMEMRFNHRKYSIYRFPGRKESPRYPDYFAPIDIPLLGNVALRRSAGSRAFRRRRLVYGLGRFCT